MALLTDRKFIHFNRKSDFEALLNANAISDKQIVFLKDAQEIWTHGTYYGSVEQFLDETNKDSTNAVSAAAVYQALADDGEVIAAALNDLNDKYTNLDSSKQDVISDLDTIRENAQSGASKVSNVQADWNATSGKAQILNKPDIPDEKLSSSYQTSTLENDNLLLAGGDTYETAFSKIEKAILDNEETIAASLNDLNTRKIEIDDVPTKTSQLTNDSNFTTLSEVTLTIVNSAPETLDTLNELAAALGDDPNFATTVANQIGQKYTKPNTGIPASDLAAGVIPAAPGTLNTTATTAQTTSSSEALSGAIKLHKVSKTGSYSDLIKPSTGIPKTDLTSAVLTSLGKADSAIQGVKVNGTSVTPDSNKIVDITIPEGELSTNYEPSSLDNEDLELAAGDTYEEAFGKLEKSINDNEEITAAALTDLDERIPVIDQELSETSENPVQNKVITQAIIDNEYVVSTALNNINDRLENKQDTLVSGTNIKTINNQSLLGEGNITIEGGSGGGGDTNIIETVKVNGTALTPDANKAVDITVPTTLDSISDGTTRKLSNYLPLSGGTMTGAITVGSGDGKGLLFSTTSNINVSGTTNTILGFYNGTYIIGHTSYPVNIRGNATRPLYNGNQLALYSDIPSAVTESTVSGWGFTKNAGTITGITMNGASKGTSGVVDLGTVITSETTLSKGTTTGNGNAVTDISVNGHQITLTKGTTFLTSHQGIKTLKTDNTTAQSTSSSETIAGSGTINLHKVAKTGTYSDLIGKPTIPTVNNATLTIQKNGTTVNTFTANASSNVTANIQVNELPTVSSSDNGKVLMVVNGAWSLVMPTSIYSGTSTPDSNTGNNGDIYLQTS